MSSSSQDWEAFAHHYATADTSEELERAERDDDAAAAPMVTTSLRLPRATMDELRRQAQARGMRPTQLLRELVESGLADADTTLISLSDALHALRQAAVTSSQRDARAGVPRSDTDRPS
jgi:predicted DNA-binding ribbon-helix-helix protein